MPQIESPQEAQSVARLIQDGQLTGESRDQALAALRDFDAQHTAATQAQDSGPAFSATEQLFPGMSLPEQGQAAKTGIAAVIRSPVNFFEGAGQAVLRVGKALGIPGAADRLQQYEGAVKDSRDQFAAANGPGAVQLSDLSAAALPIGGTAGATEKAGGALLSYLWSTAKAGAAGATVAATHVTDEDKSKLGEVAWGAAFPATVQAISGVMPAARNAVSNMVMNAEANVAPRIQSSLAAARQFWEGGSVKPPAYTIAQTSGNPVIQRLEARARGPLMIEHVAQQVQATKTRFDDLADAAEQLAAQNPKADMLPPVGAKGIAENTHGAVYDLSRAMKREANQGYETGLAEVSALAKGSTATVPLNNLREAYRSALAEADNPFNLSGADIPPSTRKAFALLSDMQNKGVGATADHVAEIMRGINSGVTRGETVLTPQQATMNRIARDLREALDTDLDAALTSRQGVVPFGTRNATRDPFDRLNEVRQEYAVRRQRIGRLEDDSITRLFGSKEVLAQPRAALQQFYSLAPEDMIYARDVLQARAPEILQGMRGDRLRGLLQAATTEGPNSMPNFDPVKFRQLMYDGQDGVVNTHLWDNATRAKLLEGAQHLRVLQNSLPGLGGTPVFPEDLAINAISRNPAFMTRLATRVAYGRWGDQLLGTEDGLRALRSTVVVSQTNKQAAAQSAAWMMNLLQKETSE